MDTDLNAADLYQATKSGDIIEVNRLIGLRRDINIDWRYNNEDGFNSLIEASFKGFVAIVEILLKNGANVNSKSKKGVNALIAASYHGFNEVVSILLRNGIFINETKDRGCTALDYARMGQHDETVLILEKAISDEGELKRVFPTIIDQQNSSQWSRGIIMTVGPGNSGKTQLCNSIVGNPFEPVWISTVGINNSLTVSIHTADISTEQGIWSKKVTTRNDELFVESLTRLVSNQLDESIILNRPNESDATNINATTPPPPSPASPPRPLNSILSDSEESKVIRSVYKNILNFNKSDLTVSFLDFGGQFVFDVVHSMFLVTNCVYLVVFNMEEMSVTFEDDTKRKNCLLALRQWLNSISASTSNSNSNGNVTRVALVGTRKDTISDPTTHLAISNLIFEEFQFHPIFNSLILNQDRTDINPTQTDPDLLFFPVSNVYGAQDPIIRRLMNQVQAIISQSSYAKFQVSFTWLKSIDKLSSLKKSYFKKSDVLQIMEENGLSEAAEQDEALKFFREMGSILWLDDHDVLKDIIIFDIVDYLVNPITNIIRNHDFDINDGSIHPLRISLGEFHSDWNRMIKTGQVTEPLLKHLLSNYADNYDAIVELMILFDLMVLLLPNYQSSINPTSPTALHRYPVYLVPSLLPNFKDSNPEHAGLINAHSWNHRCYLAFTLQNGDLLHKNVISASDLQKQGFLTKGIFERIIIKSLQWCQNTSLWNHFHLFRDRAILRFGKQTFQLLLLKSINSIEISITGNDPIAICNRLKDQLDEVLKELRYKTLAAFIVLPLLDDHRTQVYLNNDHSNMLLIPYNVLKGMVEDNSGHVIAHNFIVIDHIKAMELYSLWIHSKGYIPPQPDLFLSYRWVDDDKSFVRSISDGMANFNIDVTNRSVNIFLDVDCLPSGCYFQSKFSDCLIATSVICPIISNDTLIKIETDQSIIDNVLLEWCLAIECYAYGRKGNCQVVAVYPIFRFDVWKDPVSGVDVALSLPNIIPTATVEMAEVLLRGKGIEPLADLKSRTIRQLFQRMRGFLCCKAYDAKYQTRPYFVICKEMVDLIFSKIQSPILSILSTHHLSQHASSLIKAGFKEIMHLSLLKKDFDRVAPDIFEEVDTLTKLFKVRYGYQDIDSWSEVDKVYSGLYNCAVSSLITFDRLTQLG
eukprot:gene9644-12984_t